MGIATKLFLGATLESGIDLVLELAQIERYLENLDWLITGEGKLDEQTLSGKTIQGLLNRTKSSQRKVAAFCGQSTLTAEQIESLGIDHIDSVAAYAHDLDDAINNTATYLEKLTINFLPRLSL